MPPIYKFRVKFEDVDDVSRDIELMPTNSFKEFHKCIQQSIGFDDSHPASFYMSNDNWIKGKEISSHTKTDKSGNPVSLMKDSLLNKFISDPHQKIYYVFDKWTFFIELIKIQSVEDKKSKFPRCVKIFGEAPKQYKVILPIPGSVLEITPEEAVFEADAVDMDSMSEETFDEDQNEVATDTDGGEEPVDEEAMDDNNLGEII